MKSKAQEFAELPKGEREKFLGALSDEEVVRLQYDWNFWARPEQKLMEDNWFIWLILSGRGGGKTRTGSEAVRQWAEQKYSPIALVGQSKADVRDTMVELGDSSIMKISPPDFMPVYEPSKRRLTWPNGVQAVIYSGDEPDQLRGPQHCFVAGTMVLTPDGERPIEEIKEGDYVLTRKGKRRATNIFNRIDEVGRVKFSNGAELVATRQHPVLQLSGWTRISELPKGGIVCTGEKLLTDILRPTSVARRFTSTDGFGNKLTELSHVNLKSTIRTRIARTIVSSILSFLKNHLMSDWKMLFGLLSRLSVLIAGRSFIARDTTLFLPCVNLVSLNGQNTNGSPLEFVRYAGTNSCQESSLEAKGTSVASVVSTWEAVGQARVYNLTVADPPEFIANGIIVHNSKAWVDEIAKFMHPQLTWDNLLMGLRAGSNPQALVTTTPRPLKILRDMVKDPRVKVTRGHTLDNKANLAPEFMNYIMAKYQGTKLGRQELAGELLEKLEGLVYDTFRPDICVIPRFALPIDWPRYTGHDFGENNTACLWYAQDPHTGFLYLYRTYLKGGGITEHADNFKELSKGERVLRRSGGNHTSEQPIREGYALAGWPISEPVIRSVQAQIERVKDLNNQNKVYVFSDLSDYLEEKLTMSWAVDKEENITPKIHNESQYHFMACERGILSGFAPEVANQGRALQPTYG